MDLRARSREIRHTLEKTAMQLDAEITKCEDNIEKVTVQKLEAQAEGDLRENAAYHTAVDTLARLFVDQSILHNKKGAWERFQKLHVSGDFVGEGSTVKLQKVDTKEIFTGTIVPEELGDAENGAFPITSEVGKALLGKTVEDKISVTTSVEKGILYEILEIC